MSVGTGKLNDPLNIYKELFNFMERKFTRIISAIMSVVMFVFAVMDISLINAEGTPQTVICNESNMKITKKDATINGVAIANGMTVHNNDVLEFVFEWKLIDDEIQPPVTIKCDLSSVLKNIKLDNKSITTGNSAKYEVSEQILYITLEDGESDREGKFELSGVIDLTSAQVDSLSQTEIKLIDEAFIVKAPDLITSLNIGKSCGNIKYENGEYYIPFTVDIYNYQVADAENVTFTDLFDFGDSGIYDGAELLNLTVNGESKSLECGETLSLGTIKGNPSYPDNHVLITYDLKISHEKALSGKLGKNTADISYNNGYKDVIETVECEPNLPKPSIAKTGTLSADKSQIEWEIQVTPGLLFENSAVTADFTVTDTPDGTFFTASDIAAITGGTANADGTVTIDKSKFTNDNGVYKLSYTTPLSSGIADTVLGVKINNKAKANLKLDSTDYPTFEASKEILISAGDPGTLVEKMGKLNSATGMIDWEIKVYVPDDPSMTKVSIMENTHEGSNDHYIDFDSVQIFVDGVQKNYTIDQAQHYEVGQRFDLVFGEGKNPLSEVIGKTITIKLSSDPEAENYAELIYKNKANVDISNKYNTISKNAIATVAPNISASKEGWAESNGSAAWLIKVFNVNGKDYTEADTIVVEDTLPEGIIFDNSAEYYVTVTNYNNKTIPTVAVVGQVVRFEFKLSGSDLALFNETDSWLNLNFKTKMTQAGYVDMQLNTPNGSKYQIENNANITIDGSTIPVSGTADVYVSHTNLLDKKVVSSSVTGNEKFTATYSIDVNKEALDLLAGSDKLTLTDSLGIWLEVDENSVTITEGWGNPAPEASFSVNGNNIVFNLDDGKHYRITYDVEGKRVPMASSLSDEDIKLLFDNTVVLEGKGGNNVSSSVTIPESTFEIGGIYMYSIKIKGTKVWSDTDYSAARPRKIELKVECTKIDIRGNKTAYEPYSKSISVLVGTDPTTNVWTYEITGLISMDEFCNSYEYNIKEVTVDGYSATYTYANGNALGTINKDSNIIITNTFDAYLTEKGSVKVKKNWVDSSSDTRPESITFVIKDGAGNEVGRKTINVADTDTATFTDLPLYTYSRDASDNLVRKPIEYTIEEVNAGSGYTATYSDEDGILTNRKFTIVDTGVAGAASEVKVLTVTNTANNPAVTTTDDDKPVVTTTDDDPVVTTTDNDKPDVTTTPDGIVTTTDNTSATTLPSLTTSVTQTTTKPIEVIGTTSTTSVTNTTTSTSDTVTTSIDGFTTTSTTTVTSYNTTVTTKPSGTTTVIIPSVTSTPTVTTTKISTTTSNVTSDTTETGKLTVSSEVEENTTTTENPDTSIEEDDTTTAEKPESTTDVEEVTTDTTLPPDEFYEDGDNYDDNPNSGDYSEDASDDYEENPDTGVTIPVTFVAAMMFGAYAICPCRKKKK